MYGLLNIAACVAVVLSGMPHVFCACGCSGTVGRGAARHHDSAPACPHCASHRSHSPQDSPRPCECPHCRQVQATAPDRPATTHSPAGGAWLGVAPPAAMLAPLAIQECPFAADVGPPADSPGPLCPLPILFGHLLF